MCGAGLHVRCWGGCVVAVQAEQGAWVVLTGRCGCLRWVEQLARFLQPTLTPPERTVAGVEGWILGVG